MTVSQRQALLFYLGYYTGALDGDWGKGSRAGCEAFQHDYGLTADGLGGPVTDKALIGAVAGTVVPVRKSQSGQETEDSPEWWKDIRYFKRSEFRCPCPRCGGFPVEPDEKLVRTVDEIRHRLGRPIGIVDSGGSGVRCPAHNAEVGGVANSEHLYGRAADLHCSSATPAQLKAVAEAVMGATGGIGLYDWGIHVDVGKYSRWTG